MFANPDIPIVIFPAGLCSRKGKEGIADLKWQKMFINKAVQYHRDIIPVYFNGKNSAFFIISGGTMASITAIITTIGV